jgi:hypothetical protein
VCCGRVALTRSGGRHRLARDARGAIIAIVAAAGMGERSPGGIGVVTPPRTPLSNLEEPVHGLWSVTRDAVSSREKGLLDSLKSSLQQRNAVMGAADEMRAELGREKRILYTPRLTFPNHARVPMAELTAAAGSPRWLPPL